MEDPDRIIINPEGEAIHGTACLEHGIEVAVVFTRNDGWTLGAPADLVDAAYELWSDTWKSFQLKQEFKARPIEEWSKFRFLFKAPALKKDPDEEAPVPEEEPEDFKTFLDKLRDSGKINMFGAVPFLQEQYPALTRNEAKELLLKWMEENEKQ